MGTPNEVDCTDLGRFRLPEIYRKRSAIAGSFERLSHFPAKPRHSKPLTHVNAPAVAERRIERSSATKA
jgi:hypothetical protein